MLKQSVYSAARAGGRFSSCLRKAFNSFPRINERRSFVAHGASTPNVQELAKLSQIAVSDKEATDWQPKINSIIDWFGQLQQVDVSGVAPAIHASEHGTPLRQDEAHLNDARSELLAMAPALEKSYVRVPKIVTGADAEAAASPPAAAAEPAAAGPAAASSSGSGAAPDSTGPPSAAELDTFHSLEIRVGRVLSCERHPDADSLYVEKIDVGEAEPRTIVSGLVKYVPIEKMQDLMVVVICNLKPRNMRGIKSFGMVLAASNEEHTAVEPLVPPAGATPGDRVFAVGHEEQPAPASANAVEKKKHWDAVQPLLKTGADCTATWKGLPLNVSAGALKAASLVNARIA